MRAVLGVIAAVALLATGCTTKNIGDAFVTQVVCEEQGDYWVDDVNGCLSEGQVLTWLESACYCETFLACQERGFPEFGLDGSGCNAATYKWEDGDPNLQGSVADLDLPEGAILLEEAAQYVGEVVTFCGDIAGARRAETSKRTPTYIDLGKRYPDSSRVSVLIWGKDLAQFPEDPQEAYAKGSICVVGEIAEGEDSLQIEVSKPQAITKLR